MTTILIVDDSEPERRRVGALLEAGAADAGHADELTLLFAGNGREALAVMEQTVPDVVLTDLQMPEMDGLELVEEVRLRHPTVPVVLISSHGSEETAVVALKRGASGYVPKRNLGPELVDTVESLLSLTQDIEAERRVMQYLTRSEAEFALENDSSLVPPLVRHVQENLKRTRLCDETAILRVTVALREALVNAIEHGNLEAKSELKDADEAAFHRLVNDRRTQAPYRDRRVYFTIRETPDEVVYVIRDQGPGFSPDSLPDPTDPANLERPHGRGLLLIRSFMDDVRHNATGNEITMVKRRGPAAESAG